MGDSVGGKWDWALEGAIGVLGGGAVGRGVDVSRPELGLRELQTDGCKLDGRWFCVRREAEPPSQASATSVERSWPLSLAEAYVRGADLVANYQASSDWPYSPQIYWRAGPLDSVAGVVASLALLVSVQTHLLDTYPRIVVDSELPAESAIQLAVSGGQPTEPATIGSESRIQASAGVCCILRRIVGHPLSVAEFMPASDFREVRARCGSDGNCSVQWELFAEFLEKGVIRRARVHGAFLRRDNDLEAAVKCCEAIERESLPLTT